MDPILLWVLVAIAALTIAAVAWLGLRKRRSGNLRERFGPEYHRMVEREGDVRRAESALEAREKRVKKLQIRPLSGDDASRFRRSWKDVQTRFVDDPKGAVTDADRLVGEVMAIRGYPVGDFEQQVADISVDHPDVVINYRAARELAVLHERGEAGTEDLRQAMVHYHALFLDLLETADGREESLHDTARRDEPVHDRAGRDEHTHDRARSHR